MEKQLQILDIIEREWLLNTNTLISDCCNAIIIWDNELPMCSSCKKITKILKI